MSNVVHSFDTCLKSVRVAILWLILLPFSPPTLMTNLDSLVYCYTIESIVQKGLW